MENDTLSNHSVHSAPPWNHLLRHSLWHIRGYAPIHANQPRYATNLDRVSVALALFCFGRPYRGYLFHFQVKAYGLIIHMGHE